MTFMIQQILMAHYGLDAGGGVPLSATFLGGREDLDPGRSTTEGNTYSSTTFTMPTSISNNMPSGTSLIVVVQTFEKTNALYDGGPSGTGRDITDTDGNVWDRVAGVHDGAATEVRVATCELSSLPSSFTVHYKDNRDRACNTAWYALQNYSSATPVTTDTTTGDFELTAGSTTVTTQAGDFVITGSCEDGDPSSLITGSANMSSDFDTRARTGSTSGNQVSVVSETAAGTSVTHTLPTHSNRRDATMVSVVFRGGAAASANPTTGGLTGWSGVDGNIVVTNDTTVTVSTGLNYNYMYYDVSSLTGKGYFEWRASVYHGIGLTTGVNKDGSHAYFNSTQTPELDIIGMQINNTGTCNYRRNGAGGAFPGNNTGHGEILFLEVDFDTGDYWIGCSNSSDTSRLYLNSSNNMVSTRPATPTGTSASIQYLWLGAYKSDTYSYAEEAADYDLTPETGYGG